MLKGFNLNMEFRTVLTQKEQIEAVELSKSIFKENMAEQFTLLFSESNWKHMFIAIEQNKIVSLVNYYPSMVQIGSCKIFIASIGSVCTKTEFRSKKLASKLLILAEQQMKKENIDIVVISGGGGIYTEFGSSLAGNVYEYLIDKTSLLETNEMTVENDNKNKLNDMISIQKQEEVKFIRNDEEFNQLLISQTYPDTFATYPVYLIIGNDKTVGYIVGILPTEGDEFGIKEFAGDRNAIFKSFKMLLSLNHRDKIHFAADVHDEINNLLKNHSNKIIHQHASFKIINFCALMEKLSPYFDKIYPNHDIQFYFQDNKAIFKSKDEVFVVDSSILLSQIILGFDQPLNIELDKSPNIKAFIDKVFPIPFVWTNNMNYQ